MTGKIYVEWQKEHLDEQGKILRKLQPLKKRIENLEIEHKKIKNTIDLLKNPRRLDDILSYFTKANINSEIRRRFAPAGEVVLDAVIDRIRPTIGDAISDFHTVLPTNIKLWIDRGRKDKDPALAWVKDQSAKFQDAQKKLDKIVDALEAGNISLPAGSPRLAHRLTLINILSDLGMRSIIADELDKLDELQAAIDYSQLTQEELERMLQVEEMKLKALQNKISQERMKADAFQKQLEPVESALYITEERYLSISSPRQPIATAALQTNLGTQTKKWCFIATDLYDGPNGRKLEKIPNRIPIPQRAVVELTGKQKNIDDISWLEIIYNYSEYSKNEKKWMPNTVTGWVNAVYLDDYIEVNSPQEVNFQNATEDPSDAKQYMFLDADFDGKLDPDVKYNMCGELCVSYIVKYEIDPESNIETVLKRWKDSPGKRYSAKTIKEGTNASDLKNILQTYDEYDNVDDTDLIVDFRTGLKDGALSYEGMKDKLKTHYLIALITIDKSGALVNKNYDNKTLHWVLLERFTRNGKRLELYNPFPNMREEYSFTEFVASCRPSLAGLWVKRKKAIKVDSDVQPVKQSGQVALDVPRPEDYKAEQYIIREGEKKTNLCGEFCVAYIVGKSFDEDNWQMPPSGLWELVNILKAYGFRKKEGKDNSGVKTFSIGAVLDHWKDTQPSLYEYHVTKNKPTGTRELRSILTAYGYSKDDFEEFNNGLTDKSAGYLPSPGRMKKKLETHFLIAGVGIDGSTGRLIVGPKGVRHWEVLERLEPVGRHYVDKHFGGNGGWVELYNPFTNIMEEYSYREFTDSMSETGLWAGLWVKRDVNPAFEPQDVLPAAIEEKGNKGGRKAKGDSPVRRWPEQKLMAEITKRIKHGTSPEKIPNLLIKEGTGWSAEEIIKRLPSKKHVHSKMTAELEASICKRLGIDSLPPEISEWIADKSNGDPVFAVDLACTLRDSGILEVKDEKGIVRLEFDSPELLDTFRSAITSRFVDISKPASQATLKIAHTIGFAFSVQAAEDIKKIQAKQYNEAKKAAFLKNRPKPEMALLPIREYAEWTDELAAADDSLWKVRIWGDPKLGLTVESESVKEKAPSNFQAVGLYNEVTARGAVSNFITIEREDIDMLMALQIEDDFKAKEKDWLKQKMNWLCKEKGTIYFTRDTGNDWETGPFIFWGTLALGGNLVRIEGDPITMEFPGAGEPIDVVKLAGFRKSDWFTPLDKLLAEGLVHRCFCANSGNPPNRPVDSPKGIVYSPFFSLPDWRFGEGGHKKPRALYIPIRQLVKPVKNAEGKVYERILELSGPKDEEATPYKGIVEKLKEYE